ncbi:hypothetical protein [Sandaracinus amylolyticus]|uniref:hypothetical protein n=1 Tax=Sandaracinus amylolyticus TaxID=927083 RepID=UPI001F1D7E4C|nr:hypothetical protein [Sandaracinus amylolyticus]UJR84269.1 Hypothetical protein I5071_63460 [Sandaracinus amylolyticus]
MRTLRGSLGKALVLIAVVVGCTSEDSLSLDVADDGSVFDDINSRLPITVRQGPGGYRGVNQPAAVRCHVDFGCTAEDLAESIRYGCVTNVGAGRRAGTCGDAVASVEDFVCAANTMLAIVEYPGTRAVAIAGASNASPGVLLIPPQDAESNAQIATYALEYAYTASRLASQAFEASVCPTTELVKNADDDDSSTLGPLNDVTLGEELAHFLRESFEIGRDAAAYMGEQGAAVSDAAYSRRADRADAAQALLAPYASRSSAAHALVGGEQGLPAITGVATEGFFTRPPLSGEGMRALELLRAAALDPRLVADTSSNTRLDYLVTGGGTVTAENSLRYRLGYMQDRAALRTATADGFYEQLGVARDAFSEAREYMREEIRAFDRSPAAILPVEPLPEPGQTTATRSIVLYAATRNAPQQLLPSYWAAVLRHDTTPSPQPFGGTYTWESPPPWEWRATTGNNRWVGQNQVVSGDSWGAEMGISSGAMPRVIGHPTLASLYDQVYRRVPEIMAAICPSSCTGTLAAANNVLADTLADFHYAPASGNAPPRYDAASYLGRARACVYNRASGVQDLIIDVGAAVNPAELSVVVGRDGLECAVRGTLEGTPCTPAMLTERTRAPTGTGWTNSSWGATSEFYRAGFLDVDDTIATRPSPSTMTLFVVRRRANLTGDPLPGQFEELTGWVLRRPTYAPSPLFPYCQNAVIAPELDRRAAALIQPSPTDPTRSAESCAGIPSDFRLPLENELTDDGNGIESSWRHYLELARRSADEADVLGEELLRSGLEMDLRAEAAADELSRLCGVTINLTSVSDRIAPVAHTLNTTNCVSPYVRDGTQCVLDPVLFAAANAVSDEDLRRVASCIGADIVPWATLGDQSLCIWDQDASSPRICENATPDMPCPFAATSTGACSGPTPGVTATAVTERVGLFQMPSDPEPAPPDPLDLPCAALTAVRAGTATPAQRTELYSSALLTYDGFSSIARQLTWEAQPGDYSAVRFAGSRVFHTGSVTGPPTSTTPGTWPMGPRPTGAVCASTSTPYPTGLTDSRTLFCFENAHTTSSGSAGTARRYRAQVNDLLARAVLAARTYAGLGPGQSVFPYYPATGAHTFRANADTISWDHLGSSSPSVFCSGAGEYRIDHFTAGGVIGGDSAGEYSVQIADLGSEVCSIQPTGTSSCNATEIPAGAEWARCSYESSSPTCSIFDDAQDCDDPTPPALGNATWDRNAPLLLRMADDGLGRTDSAMIADRLWRDYLPDVVRRFSSQTAAERAAYMNALELRDGTTVQVGQLTNYFRSWDDEGLGRCRREEYEDCIGDRPARRLLEDGNLAFIAPDGLTQVDFLNGLELACYAARQQIPVDPLQGPNCVDPGPVNNISDSYRLAAYFECRANAVSTAGANTIVRNLPRRVIEALRQDGPGLYGTGSGEFDAQVSEIRSALVELSNTRYAIAADLRAFASRLRGLRAAVATSERARQIEQLLSFGRSLDRMTSCLVATTQSAQMDPVGAAGAAAGATATCQNSIAQIILDEQVQRLREQDIEDRIVQEFSQFNIEATQYQRSFSERAVAIRTSFERIDAALSRLHGAQAQARRALARALLLDSNGSDEHSAVNTVMRARQSTLLARYRRAHQRAVRAAYIARLALEQRLGMQLSEMEDDIFSDEPPREWVDTICTLPSIDYDTIRAGGGADGDAGVPTSTNSDAPDDYSGAYVGDYVRRLEQVFESYSFVHPFREGTDTAVVSLRDDIFRVRAPCDVETPNLLYNGSRLDVLESGERPGWRIEGCPAGAPGSGIVQRACVTVQEIPTDTTTLLPTGGFATADFGRAVPYRVSIGETADATTATSALTQRIMLPAGRHRLSWYARTGPTGGIPADYAFEAITAAGASLGPASASQVFREDVPNVTPAAQWRRYWYFIDLRVDTEVVIRLEHGGPAPITLRDVDVAGVMLEDVTRQVVGNPSSGGIGQNAPPSPFFDTGDSGYRTVRACRDDRGIHFRREAWERTCARTCADGTDGRCPPESEEIRCYWQTSFDASADRLQRMLREGDAGFAAGNYNYRIDAIAVNLVGTGLRDCEGRGTAGCFGSGNLSFSMLHVGPYPVRNALGATYDAPLFPGRLESARALAAERYITNPISSTDLALIQPYTRVELQGRPLAGTLVLRIWEDPSFRFERLEDVQLVLTYRYWQHQR